MPQTGQAKNPPRAPGRLRRLGVSAWLSLGLGASLTVGLAGCGGEPPARPGAPVGETSGAATTAVERTGPANGPETGPGTENGASAAAGTGGGADKATSETAAPLARTLPQLLGDSETEGFLGVVVTRDAVDVAAETAGRVESVAVRVGDRVSRGDVLARLDTRELEQDLGMARASLTAAEAEVTRIRSQVREAETRYKRRNDLPDIFSREELESAKMEMETAEATLKAAEARVSEQEAQVEQLRDRLGRTEIRAPFEGTVALRYLDPGATVLAGSPVVRLLSTEELLVRFAVPPEKVESLAVGDQVEVAIEDAEVRSPATVLHIAPEIDGPSRMVFVEARLDAPEETLGRIRSGLVARVFHS